MIAPGTDVITPRIARVHCTDDFLVVTLSSGRTLSIPLDWYPTLRDSAVLARTDASVRCDGAVICWPALPLEISLDALLAGGRERSRSANCPRVLARET